MSAAWLFRRVALGPIVGLTLAGAVGFPEVIMGQDDQPRKGQRQASPAAAQAPFDAKTCIDDLKSHNPAPLFGDDRPGPGATPLFDKTFDWGEQDRVKGAIRAIVKHAADAWPQLIRHMDDRSYCITIDGDNGATNRSVGSICSWIVSRNLAAAYYPLMPHQLRREVVYTRFVTPAAARGSDGLKAWCDKRGKRPLYELQIEMCEWSIDELGRMIKGDEIPEVEGNASIAAVRSRIAAMRKSKEPVVFPGFGKEEFQTYSQERASKVRANRETK